MMMSLKLSKTYHQASLTADELANDLDTLTPPSDIEYNSENIQDYQSTTDMNPAHDYQSTTDMNPAHEYQSTTDVDPAAAAAAAAAAETDVLHDDEQLAVSGELDHSYSSEERVQSQATELVNIRNANRYELRPSTREKHDFSTMSIKAARRVHGKDISDKGTRDELMTCIEKDVWECLDATYITKNAIPSRMFLTPKTLPDGELDRVKGRIVAGGHRQDRSLYEDKEISSPTVALTSVLTMTALAAKEGRHVMTLDHKAAYLNARTSSRDVNLSRSCGDSFDIDNSYRKYVSADKKIAVRLKKALYRCVQSAMLWYNELTATLENMGFNRNPYDTCSFSRAQEGSHDRILVYVDDLFLTSASKSRLQTIADTLKSQYKAVTYETGLHHDFLGIHWDFSIPGQASLSMDGYLNDIITKY